MKLFDRGRHHEAPGALPAVLLIAKHHHEYKTIKARREQAQALVQWAPPPGWVHPYDAALAKVQG